MPKSMRHIAREVGVAVAVLAVYMLVLLGPLHQSAGLQRELARLGFESSVSWSVCTSVANPVRGDDETPTAAKCPLTGVAKSQLAFVLPPVGHMPPPRRAEPVHYQADVHVSQLWLADHPGQPRGPPQTA